MLLVLIKSCVEICGAVSGPKHRKEACVVDGVRVSNIDNLHVKLEAAVTLIPSELHPHLTGGYCAIMPHEAVRRSTCNHEKQSEVQQKE